ncbi:MAG TPA: ABC transporter substrate-binding protein [Nitrospirales bacterium]|nr:ABC transporter substrate-binding protein [Nitrospirales bacterium]
MIMSSRFAFLVVGLFIVTCAATAAWAGDPTEQVNQTAREISRILHDQELRQPGMTTERRRQLDDVISARLSYEDMSRHVLGAQWEQRSIAEQQEFIELFRSLLCMLYANKIEDYAGERMEFLGERITGEMAEVRARIAARKSQVMLDFRLVNRSGEWRVYDILTDGISLVNNYRQQFQRVLRQTSYADLVGKLRDATERTTAALARY